LKFNLKNRFNIVIFIYIDEILVMIDFFKIKWTTKWFACFHSTRLIEIFNVNISRVISNI